MMKKYQDLREEIGRLSHLRKVKVVSVVIRMLGSVTKDFKSWMEKQGMPCDSGVKLRKKMLC